MIIRQCFRLKYNLVLVVETHLKKGQAPLNRRAKFKKITRWMTFGKNHFSIFQMAYDVMLS